MWHIPTDPSRMVAGADSLNGATRAKTKVHNESQIKSADNTGKSKDSPLLLDESTDSEPEVYISGIKRSFANNTNNPTKRLRQDLDLSSNSSSSGFGGKERGPSGENVRATATTASNLKQAPIDSSSAHTKEYRCPPVAPFVGGDEDGPSGSDQMPPAAPTKAKANGKVKAKSTKALPNKRKSKSPKRQARALPNSKGNSICSSSSSSIGPGNGKASSSSSSSSSICPGGDANAQGYGHIRPGREELAAAQTDRARGALQSWYHRLRDLYHFQEQHGHNKFPNTRCLFHFIVLKLTIITLPRVPPECLKNIPRTDNLVFG